MRLAVRSPCLFPRNDLLWPSAGESASVSEHWSWRSASRLCSQLEAPKRCGRLCLVSIIRTSTSTRSLPPENSHPHSHSHSHPQTRDISRRRRRGLCGDLMLTHRAVVGAFGARPGDLAARSCRPTQAIHNGPSQAFLGQRLNVDSVHPCGLHFSKSRE